MRIFQLLDAELSMAPSKCVVVRIPKSHILECFTTWSCILSIIPVRFMFFPIHHPLDVADTLPPRPQNRPSVRCGAVVKAQAQDRFPQRSDAVQGPQAHFAHGVSWPWSKLRDVPRRWQLNGDLTICFSNFQHYYYHDRCRLTFWNNNILIISV